MNLFNRILTKYNNDGLDGIFYTILRLMNVKVPYANLLDKKRFIISQNIKKNAKT